MGPADHKLVFVGGLHRSGTTPMARCLSEHPQVSGFSDTGAIEDEGQHLQSVYPAANTHGGPGRFALAPEAHLTEESPLATEANAARLFEQWSPHWDLTRPVLVEKSPPNLVMSRFLQALYPDAYFVMVVRHPVVVTLSTKKWARITSLKALMDNWFNAHETFEQDSAHLRRLTVVKYEDFVTKPVATLGALGDFLGLDGDIPSTSVQPHRSSTYEQTWRALAQHRMPWRSGLYRRLCETYDARANHFGYSLLDLGRVDPFPVP